MENSPHTAVVLMIEPDHLDIHASFDEYIAAKQNIVRFQTETDVVVFASNNIYSGIIASGSKAKKIAVQSEFTVRVSEGYFWHEDQKLCSVDALKLPGVHNQDNACAAIAATWEYTQDGDVIEQGLADFTGLPHRLKLVRSVNEVSYYDDSIATTLGSAIAAVRAFPQPKILILGGSSKGVVDFDELASEASKGGVKKALLIGDQASAIENSFTKYSVPIENLGSDATMDSIVRQASELAESGDVVILSPACASFGMFKNYADRGDQFVAAVNSL
jgi:UDP-N-acetylmuramoylalanine--D-glutamate ligase